MLTVIPDLPPELASPWQSKVSWSNPSFKVIQRWKRATNAGSASFLPFSHCIPSAERSSPSWSTCSQSPVRMRPCSLNPLFWTGSLPPCDSESPLLSSWETRCLPGFQQFCIVALYFINPWFSSMSRGILGMLGTLLIRGMVETESEKV